MRLKGYQWAELAGMLFLLASTAAQIFYVEPLKREIEWRLAAFNMQQNGQIQTKAIYDSRIATLKAVNAPADAITTAEKEHDALIEKYKTADANIADYLYDKERVEDYLQIIVIGLFALGTLLAGFGRAMEMRAGGKP
jgi:hypothetical protein